jgi:hypothetical protein
MGSIAQRRRRILAMRSSSQLGSCHALAARDRYCIMAIADALGEFGLLAEFDMNIFAIFMLVP